LDELLSATNLLYAAYCLLLTCCLQWVPEAHVSLDELLFATNLLYAAYCLSLHELLCATNLVYAVGA